MREFSELSSENNTWKETNELNNYQLRVTTDSVENISSLRHVYYRSKATAP